MHSLRDSDQTTGSLLQPISWRGLLLDSAGAGAKTVEIPKSAHSRTNTGAINTAGIQAKFDLIPETAGSGPKPAPGPIDTACCTSPGREIANSTGSGTRRA